jgi:hypothetical protein
VAAVLRHLFVIHVAKEGIAHGRHIPDVAKAQLLADKAYPAEDEIVLDTDRGHHCCRDLAAEVISLYKQLVEKILHLHRNEQKPCTEGPDDGVGRLHLFHDLQESWLGFARIGGQLGLGHVYEFIVIIEETGQVLRRAQAGASFTAGASA